LKARTGFLLRLFLKHTFYGIAGFEKKR